jgi:hypothetical protein
VINKEIENFCTLIIIPRTHTPGRLSLSTKYKVSGGDLGRDWLGLLRVGGTELLYTGGSIENRQVFDKNYRTDHESFFCFAWFVFLVYCVFLKLCHLLFYVDCLQF